MFDLELLFERRHALIRQRTGPLAEDRLRFLAHLRDQAMSRSVMRCAAFYVLAVTLYLRLHERPNKVFCLDEVERQARRWARRPPSPAWEPGPFSRRRFVRWATEWLRFLGRLQPPRPPRDPNDRWISAYAEYMRVERCLSPKTIYARCSVVRRFLDRLRPSGRLASITIRQIDETLMEMATSGSHARVTIRAHASILRSFFGFAETKRWCRSGLTGAISAPRVFRHEGLPIGPTWEEITRLLALAKGDHAIDVRDRAVLLLLVVYGLRAGEIVRLRLDDLDWEGERLFTTQSKTRRSQAYPLSRPVGDAILRYLRQHRPCSKHREVFLTVRAPFRPLHGGLWRIVAGRLRRLNVSLPHHGPHALRHACATRLLAQGFSLKAIGDLLGHRNPDTTRLYAKVDLVGLRKVAEFDLGGLA
jgi:integrase/recombinase XerD